MAKMNPSKLRNVLAALPYCDLSGTQKNTIDTIITKYLAGDIVSVVRCKDCKHYHQYHVGKMKEPSGWGKCKLIDMDVDMTVNDFCSHGERIDGDPE